ncbi:aminodeoxychorismate synthase component I [Marinithermofilum abyssi]|uniref:aminodeoxychorismate synthase component I n=1 Tax=Marinithermofilum abyssi TaxID=1571185 RepID=UPI00166E852D|nr:aminodeoxychorismate synthase component I [Marinithermofilum abyssi]
MMNMRGAWKRIHRWVNPIHIYTRIAGQSGVLLDSCSRGRYTILAWDPFQQVELWQEREPEPFQKLDSLAALAPELPDLPDDAPPFLTGVVGYLGYELAWSLEVIGEAKPRRYAVPDGVLMVPRRTIVVDDERKETWVAVVADNEAEKVLQAAVEELLCWERESLVEMAPVKGGPIQMVPEIAPDDYFQRVQRVKEYIGRGDIYQANLSYRISGSMNGDPWQLYRCLRKANPGAYSAFLRFADHAILSSSPEQFIRWEKGWIETKPIKGTRPRGREQTEDGRFKEELAASEKDRAELLMIVDLERNDLGKFCFPGTVQVPVLFAIEPHPTVWHQVAVVKGQIRPGVTPGQLMAGMFPGGSITGAPKIRSMQIIHELESSRRGVYTGSIGYVDRRGNGEWNIAIRTMTWWNGELSFHVGGGIVADSDPRAEYEETIAKGKGMMEAIRRFSEREPAAAGRGM